ncbi:hypothetical protein [Gemmatimonas sp.]|uniref:hypothetical protein n=1 Tax=Gemmatimonas sp. TaxID=1962908 RepID=UPI003DA597D4
MTLPMNRPHVPQSDTEATASQLPGRNWVYLLATVGKRAAALYLTVWIATPLLEMVPLLGGLYGALLKWLVPSFAALVLGLSKAHQPAATGSGDSTYNFALAALLAIMSLVCATEWTRRSPMPVSARITLWWRDVLRLGLAFTLLVYGMAKVVPSQFPALDPSSLLLPLGDFTPMGLLWAFMGQSPLYQMFGGWCEVIPGVLLLFRRTGIAGAILAVPVLVNVVALNLFFDVPVKLHSLHYLTMASALVLPFVPALWAVVTGSAFAARLPHPVEPKKATEIRRLATVALLMWVVAETVTQVNSSAAMSNTVGDRTLHGIWERVEQSGATPAWRTLAVSWSSSVWFERDSSVFISIKADPKTHRLELPAAVMVPRQGPRITTSTISLNYARIGDTLTLSSLAGDDGMRMTFRLRDPNAMRLLRGRFRWIQDYPDSR